MSRRVLTDMQWEKIEPLLPGKVGDRGRSGNDNRLFVDAVLWLARTAAPWRDLPIAPSHGLFYKPLPGSGTDDWHNRREGPNLATGAQCTRGALAVHSRFRRWTISDVWHNLFKALSQSPDFEYVLIDATISKVHADASGAKPSHRCKQRLPGDRGLKLTILAAQKAG